MGGARWDDLAHALPPRRAAQHSEAARGIPSSGGPAADVPQSAATGAAVEPLRALHAPGFSGPASGVAGDRGDDLTGVQRTQRSEENETPASSSSGLVHVPVKKTSPRSPGTGQGRCRHSRRHRRLDCVALGTAAREGRDAGRDGGSTRSATARPREAGTRPTALLCDFGAGLRLRGKRQRRNARRWVYGSGAT